MNILQVTLGFYPAYAWGGPIKVVHKNSKELIKRGHNVTVYCTNLLDKKNKIESGTFERQIDGIRVVYFDTFHFKKWPGTLGPIYCPGMSLYLKKEILNYDIAHLNGYRNALLAETAFRARRAGVPIVTQAHGTMPILINSIFLKKIYDLILGRVELKNISAFIASHDIEKDQALSFGVPEEIIEVIHNGIDDTERNKIAEKGHFRKKYQIDTAAPLILFLARINRIKGADLLIQAFHKMKNRSAHLAIVGPDDGLLAEIQASVDHLKLNQRVHFVGQVPDDDVLSAYQDADLYVLPSRKDCFPVSVMECCLVGTPMIVSDRCEIAAVVKDKNATVVSLDTGEIAAAMDRLLENQVLRESYRNNSEKVLKNHFSITSCVDRLESVYKRCIEQG